MRSALPAVALVIPLLAGTTAAAAGPSPACQEAVARSGAKFAKVVLKVSQRCAMRSPQDAAACRVGAGEETGYPATDTAVARAARRLAARVGDACATSDTSGFARRCPDADGPPFTLEDLVACLRDTHLDRIGALVAVEFPVVAAAAQQTTGGCDSTQMCQCRCSSPSSSFLVPMTGDVL